MMVRAPMLLPAMPLVSQVPTFPPLLPEAMLIMAMEMLSASPFVMALAAKVPLQKGPPAEALAVMDRELGTGPTLPASPAADSQLYPASWE